MSIKPTVLLLLVFFLAAADLSAQAGSGAKTKTMAAKSNTEPLKIGDTAPDFTLSDQNDKLVQLSKTKTPVLLVFYRGYW